MLQTWFYEKLFNPKNKAISIKRIDSQRLFENVAVRFLFCSQLVRSCWNDIEIELIFIVLLNI